MTTLTYSKLVEQADALEAEEQLRLAAYLLERVRQTVSRDKPKRKWAEVCGLYPYPMLGEDAQEWVSRTRRESDEQRAYYWEHVG